MSRREGDGHSSPSMAKRINAAWLKKLAGEFFSMDILLIIVFSISLFAVLEQSAAMDHSAGRAADTAEQEAEVWVSSPVFVVAEPFRVFFPEETANAERYFLTPAGQGLWGRLESSVYTIRVGEAAASYRIGLALGMAVKALLVILTAQLLVIIGSAGSGLRRAKRILEPITAMALTTDTIQQKAQSVNVSQLTGTIDAINASHLDRRIPVDRCQVELRSLAVSVNQMLERLELSYRQQTQFVSDASHELRTPISVIQGYANMLDRWGKEDPSMVDESVTAIKEESERMKVLLEALLFLARSGHHTLPFAPATVELSEMLEDCRREADMIHPEYVWVCDAPSLLHVIGDPLYIKQALWILLENASGYSPEGSEITLSLKKEGSYGIASVEDEGIGMNSDEASRIFDRFYRTDASRSRRKGGAGLGLSILAGIIDMHKGKVEVVSRTGLGSRFSLYFPIDLGKGEKPALPLERI